MKNLKKTLWIFIFSLLAASSGAFAEGIKRYAMIIGVNDGGKERVVLRYATQDALAISKVFQELGGIDPQDILIVQDARSKEITREIESLSRKIEESKKKHPRVEVFFYYSGHSDEKGLLLKGDHLEYPELRTMIEKIPADVKISVLDSCSSGAITRRKGGTKVSPFLLDASMKMKGHAFITSSSYDEASQESDRLQGSFFTHYFITGLRGAADMNKDGRVTLNEIYQFAFYETLSRTEKTLSGPQHPGYEIEMVGSGDVVVTDLRQTSSLLTFDDSLEGRLSVRDSRGVFVAELQKLAGKPVQLGLEPGQYHVLLSQKGKVMESQIDLPSKGILLTLEQMTPVFISEKLARKGTEAEDYQTIPFSFSILPSFSTGNPDTGRKSLHYFSVNLLAGESDVLSGIGFGGINLINDWGKGVAASWWANYVTGDYTGVQASAILNYNSGNFLGVQAAAVGNITSKDFQGIQAAAVFNISHGKFSGIQTASVFSYNDQNVNGLQFSVINIAEQVSSQIGVINIAFESVRGLQLGVINIADNSEIPIGVINIIKNGDYRILSWFDQAGFLNLGFKMGGKYSYSMFGAGIHHEHSDIQVFSWALGAHLPVTQSLFINLEAFTQHFHHLGNRLSELGMEQGDYTGLTSFRFMAGYEFFNTLSLYAGVSLPIFYSNEGNDRSDTDWVKPLKDLAWDKDRILDWTQFFAGIQIRLF